MFDRFTSSSVLLLFFVVLSVFYFLPSKAQENHPPLFSIQTDSVFTAENESLVALTLILSNNTDSPFTGKMSLSTIRGINLIGGAEINIDANSKIYYPIRLSVGKEVPAGESLMSLHLLDSVDQVKAQFASRLLVASIRKVQLINFRPNEIMQHVGDSLAVSVLLSNRGNIPEEITLTGSFLDLTGGKIVVPKKVKLGAFKDSVVVFKRIITKDLLRVEHYSVNVAALYGNGEFINNVMISVQNLSGNRVYVDPSATGYGFDYFGSNRISLSGTNISSNNEALQLYGAGVFQLPVGSLRFNMNASQYTQYDNRPLVTNTNLNYEFNNKGIVAGNISESLETFVNGRGVKVYAKNEEESKGLELAIVDKQYNLLGDQYLGNLDKGYTAYATTYLKSEKGGSYRGNLVYDRSGYEGSENMIFMNRYQRQMQDNVTMSFDVGGGLTRAYDDPAAAYKPSFALGNTLGGSFGKYSINSNNFYSSSYYPGIRRGVIQLNGRLGRRLGKVNTWVAYSYYNYNPEYVGNKFIYNNEFANSRLEGGTSFSLGKQFNLSLSANQIREKSRWLSSAALDEPMVSLNAYRLTEAISWRSQNNLHSIYLSSENGFSESPFTDKRTLDLRATASWTYSLFNLSAYFQQGNFSVFEMMSNAQRGDDKNYRFSVSPSLRKNFFQNKLKVQVNMNYNRDSYSGENWMYSGLADYSFSRSMSAFVNSYFYQYKSSYYTSSSNAIQAGISYSLPGGQNVSSQKKGNIEVFVFHDNNSNGVFDEGDTPAVGQIVHLGGISFISQRNGVIQYKKVPYGTYSLRVPSQNWYAKTDSELDLQGRNLRIDVPLQRTGRITGKIFYNYDGRTSMEVTEKYGGLRLLVRGEDGFNSQALTNTNGEFTLFLPVGEYEFWVDENSLPKNVYTDVSIQKVKVTEGKPFSIPAIELKVKQRVIEVKRFSSE